MGLWSGKAEKCETPIPQCMTPVEVSPSEQIAMNKCYDEKIVDWRISTHGPLTKLKEQCGFPPEAVKTVMGSSYSSYGPGSFAGCDEMTQGLCGVVLGLQRGESVEEISGSLVKGGCKHCIPGCRIATAAAEGDVGGVAVGVISEASKLLGLKIKAAIIVYGVIIDTTAKK